MIWVIPALCVGVVLWSRRHSTNVVARVCGLAGLSIFVALALVAVT